MSCLSLAKKLQPAKRAWKSFANTLQSNLYKLKNSKAIKKSTHLALRSIRPLISRKRCTLGRPFSNGRRHFHQQLLKKNVNVATIYVDQLFAETVPVHPKHPHAPGETSKVKEMNAANGDSRKAKAKAKADSASMTLQQRRPVPTAVGIKIFDEKARPRKSKVGEKRTYDVDGAWKAVVASSPQLRGVDERAEDFISKFREEMKLQKDKSILDFQEMLARSA